MPDLASIAISRFRWSTEQSTDFKLTSVNEGRRGTSTMDDQISIKTEQKRDSSVYTSFVNVSCNKYQAHQLKSTLRNDMEISFL